MSKPTTPVHIVNLALDALGQAPASSIDTPTTPSEIIAARWYDQTRRELLNKFIFNFSRKPAILTLNANVPTHPDFSNGYTLPNDFVRLLKVGSLFLFGGAVPVPFYAIADNVLYSDVDTGQANTGDEIQVEYIYDAVTVTKFSALFIRCLYLQLGANMAYKFTLKSTVKKDLMEDLRAARAEAAAVSGQEMPPQRVQRSKLIDVRRAKGIWRNNTRI